MSATRLKGKMFRHNPYRDKTLPFTLSLIYLFLVHAEIKSWPITLAAALAILFLYFSMKQLLAKWPVNIFTVVGVFLGLIVAGIIIEKAMAIEAAWIYSTSIFLTVLVGGTIFIALICTRIYYLPIFFGDKKQENSNHTLDH